ncbi:acetyltransferase [Fictibacillus macauensis ZFHKF-1]|uniref:Acetyltransferase n=1 Tax=Fictibacillus macauensis ZFHKF-1 TaxID=1196324 RepID=I8AKQ3_9BACL|nr:GNAT family N-acetyltransferase [Fictibacillus macauensis]EIT86154.1 acetyltransferase [Fictibacillus macauensis ZFHKF-1]
MLKAATHIMAAEMEKLENLEVALTAFNSKRALFLEKTQLKTHVIGSSHIMADEHVPNSHTYNVVKGFGVDSIPFLDEILDWYEAQNISPAFELTPGVLTKDVAKALASKGFVCTDQKTYVTAKPLETIERRQGISIIPVTEENVQDFLDLIEQSSGRKIDAQRRKEKAHFYYDEHFPNYIAYYDGKPAGIGSLFIAGTEGYIANDFTFPLYWGYDVQKALLHHRMNVAHQKGITALYTDVEFGSITHQNMMDDGFSTLCINTLWKKLSD